MGAEFSNGTEKRTTTEQAIEERDKNGNHDSSTNTTPKRRGRPPGTTKTEEKFSGLVDVNSPKPVEIELPTQEDTPKKKPGRPPGPSKKATTAKPSKVDSTQIQFLLVTLSGLVASRPGMDVWNLTAEEAKQIADPLSHILAKNQAISNAVGEHADGIALLMACFMIFLPKFLMWNAMKPKKPKEGKEVNYDTGKPTQPQQQERQAARNPQPDARQHTKPAKTNSQNIGGQLFELIPAVGGI